MNIVLQLNNSLLLVLLVLHYCTYEAVCSKSLRSKRGVVGRGLEGHR